MPRFGALDAALLRMLEGQILRRYSLAAANAYATVGEYTTFRTMERIMKRRALRAVVNGQARQTQAVFGFGMQNFFADAAEAAYTQEMEAVGQTAQAMAESMQDSVRGSKPRLFALHQTVAAEAQAATLRAYELRVIARAGQPYRVGDPQRLANKLGEALARPDLSIVTSDGVFFGNVAMLDSVAAHWYRLNFGAGSRANAGVAGVFNAYMDAGSPVITEMGAIGGATNHNQYFFGQAVAQFAGARPPSAPFTIPFGAWFQRGIPVPWGDRAAGSDEFYPGKQAIQMAQAAVNKSAEVGQMNAASIFQGPKMTQGIAGRHFLDVGVAYLAKNLPAVWSDEAMRWLNRAKQDGIRRGPLGESFSPREAARTRAALSQIRGRL